MVLCSAVHSWDFRTFISTSSCRREKALVPPGVIRGTHKQQVEEENIFCTDQAFPRIQTWSTVLHVLNVKTSLNLASLPFCLSQHLLQCWMLSHAQKLTVSKQSSCFSSRYFPHLSPMDNGMQRIICMVLGACCYLRFSIDSSTSFSFSSSPEKWTTGLCCLVQDKCETCTLNPKGWGIFPALSNIHF